jgi:sulfide dehydrogenase cytochrome subunit
MSKATYFGTGWGAVVALATFLPFSASADDPTINRMLASQCSQCHGTNGQAVGDIDSLAGESAWEIREELLEMQFEDRPDDVMDHQALGYTDDQIRRIANYLSSLPEGGRGDIPVIRLSLAGAGNEGEDGEDREDDRNQDGYRDHDRSDFVKEGYDEDEKEDEDEEEEDEEEDEQDEEDDEDHEDHED